MHNAQKMMHKAQKLEQTTRYSLHTEFRFCTQRIARCCDAVTRRLTSHRASSLFNMWHSSMSHREIDFRRWREHINYNYLWEWNKTYIVKRLISYRVIIYLCKVCPSVTLWEKSEWERKLSLELYGPNSIWPLPQTFGLLLVLLFPSQCILRFIQFTSL